MNQEDERFAVEESTAGYQVIDLDRDDKVVTTWPTEAEAEASAARMNERFKNAAR